MRRRQDAIVTLHGEAPGDRGQHAGLRPRPQGTLGRPFPASETNEIIPQEEDSRGLKAQRFAPWQPLGMLPCQQLEEASAHLEGRSSWRLPGAPHQKQPRSPGVFQMPHPASQT